MAAEKNKPFHIEFAEQIIEQLKAGTAPWQRPWEAGPPTMPVNPVSGTKYRGSNKLFLATYAMGKLYFDPRWMTYNQAKKEGYYVRKGEKGVPIQHWQWTRQEMLKDSSGKPLFDTNGNVMKAEVALVRPIVKTSIVFNASQIDGIEPWNPSQTKQYQWDPIEKAESILQDSAATILHNHSDKAFYNAKEDVICLPVKTQFASSLQYYSTALHELGHWTGHESRMNRPSGAFGTETYAKEELRAEIASWMIAGEVGIPHDSSQHVAYIKSWSKILRDDPFELMRACRDAEAIMEFTLNLEKEKTLSQEHSQKKDSPAEPKKEQTKEPTRDSQQSQESFADKKLFLAVPYKEKNKAKTLGAQWDSQAKLWYAPKGTNLTPLQQWITTKAQPEPTMNPLDEFAQIIQETGLALEGEPPVMDGKIHRVPLLTDRAGTKNGAYCGFADGIPAGWVQNHKTGEKVKWIATGHVLTQEQKLSFQRESAQRKAEREHELQQRSLQASVVCTKLFQSSKNAPADHPYLQKKGITPENIKVTLDGSSLIVPLTDVQGDIKSLQYINAEGQKKFHPGGTKKGNFFLLQSKESTHLQDSSNQTIVIAEGLATGKSIHEATNIPVAVAFDAGNLLPVATALRERFPQTTLLLCADNDHAHRLKTGELHNKGVELAKQAATSVKGNVLVPTFTQSEQQQGYTDFNDLHMARGLNEVKKQLQKGLNIHKKLSKSLER